MIKMIRKGKTIEFKKYTRKTILIIIYADFGNILAPGKYGNRNQDDSYTNKYQNHVGYGVWLSISMC